MKNKQSFYSYFAIITILFASFCYYQGNEKRILDGVGDALGYYIYLPAIIVHGDLMTFEKSFAAKEVQIGRAIPPKGKKLFGNEQPLPDNHVLDKYTCGVAVLAAPFYIVAHIAAPILGFEQNGFSKIYTNAYLFAGLFYVFWGLWLIRKTLLCIFLTVQLPLPWFYFRWQRIFTILVLMKVEWRIVFCSSYMPS